MHPDDHLLSEFLQANACLLFGGEFTHIWPSALLLDIIPYLLPAQGYKLDLDDDRSPVLRPQCCSCLLTLSPASHPSQGYKLDLDDDRSPVLRPQYGKPRLGDVDQARWAAGCFMGVRALGSAFSTECMTGL